MKLKLLANWNFSLPAVRVLRGVDVQTVLDAALAAGGLLASEAGLADESHPRHARNVLGCFVAVTQRNVHYRGFVARNDPYG